MARRRVLFIVPLLRRAGAETQLVVLVNGLSSDDFEKHLLSYRPGDDLSEDVNTDEVVLHQLRRKSKLDFDVARSIARVIDERGIDVVHCTLQNALLFGYLGARMAKRKVRLIASIHTTRNANLKLDIADQLVYRPLMKRCDQVWFVSTKQADQWIHRMPYLADKAVVVHNGVDVDRFDPSAFTAAGSELRESLGIATHEKVVCSVAGFRPEKQHSVLIDAFQKVRARGVACRLLLAGAGPTEQALRQQVRTLGLEDSVMFLGSLADVRALLAASDCKALVSAAETFSMAMLEAMAMQVVVITTSVGGASEAIDDGETGLLLQPGDADTLAGALEGVLRDDERRRAMARRARQTILDRFTVEKMVAGSATYLA